MPHFQAYPVSNKLVDLLGIINGNEVNTRELFSCYVLLITPAFQWFSNITDSEPQIVYDIVYFYLLRSQMEMISARICVPASSSQFNGRFGWF